MWKSTDFATKSICFKCTKSFSHFFFFFLIFLIYGEPCEGRAHLALTRTLDSIWFVYFLFYLLSTFLRVLLLLSDSHKTTDDDDKPLIVHLFFFFFFQIDTRENAHISKEIAVSVLY